MTQEKECRVCRKVKPLSAYAIHPRTKDGRIGYCQECHFYLHSTGGTHQSLHSIIEDGPDEERVETVIGPGLGIPINKEEYVIAARYVRVPFGGITNPYQEGATTHYGKTLNIKAVMRSSHAMDAEEISPRCEEIDGESKRCPRCEEILPIDEFYNNKYRENGKAIYCKKCAREYMRERARKDKG